MGHTQIGQLWVRWCDVAVWFAARGASETAGQTPPVAGPPPRPLNHTDGVRTSHPASLKAAGRRSLRLIAAEQPKPSPDAMSAAVSPDRWGRVVLPARDHMPPLGAGQSA